MRPSKPTAPAGSALASYFLLVLCSEVISPQTLAEAGQPGGAAPRSPFLFPDCSAAAIEAVAGSGFGEMATGAEELKSIRKSICYSPVIHSLAVRDFRTMRFSIAVDVIEFKDFGIVIPAANATATVALDDD